MNPCIYPIASPFCPRLPSHIEEIVESVCLMNATNSRPAPFPEFSELRADIFGTIRNLVVPTNQLPNTPSERKPYEES